MMLELHGHPVHVATGGRVWTDGDDDPVVVLIHGAGMDSTVWYLQTRWLAHHGLRVAAVDLPGHGRSGGGPLGSIAAMADWVGDLAAAEAWGPVHVVGHSMGTFIGLSLAARHPDAVASLVLCGTATAMPVHPELLAAAADDLPRAAALMTDWGLGRPAHAGVNPTPGLWMAGGTQALVERSAPGALVADFEACAAHTDALADAAAVRCPTTVVAGRLDKMTPARSGRELAEALPDELATFVELRTAGHQMMTEAPDTIRRLVRDRVTAAG